MKPKNTITALALRCLTAPDGERDNEVAAACDTSTATFSRLKLGQVKTPDPALVKRVAAYHKTDPAGITRLIDKRCFRAILNPVAAPKSAVK